MKKLEDYLSVEEPMRFDFILMNPPYQAPSRDYKTGAKGNGHTAWPGFVKKTLDVLNPNGCLIAIHPPSWRRPTPSMIKIAAEIKSRQIVYLEMHGYDDGMETFACHTKYDWYILYNRANYDKTDILDENSRCERIYTADAIAIPNTNIPYVSTFFANNSDEKINVLSIRGCVNLNNLKNQSFSSDIKTDEYKYPLVYSLPQKGKRIKWLKSNTKGHFGIPKVIFTWGKSQVIIDKIGEYGLSQFATGIVDEPENLPKIKQALESEKFLKLCDSMRFSWDKYDYGFISILKKDFWKEFV